MSAVPEPSVARVDRRKARTRRALVEAARRILASRGTTDVSIQDITDEADVGLGSFYNHFSSKAELFEEAAGEALEEYGQRLDKSSAGMDDPAEIFALGVRLTAGLARTQPAVAQILVQAGEVFLVSDRGLAPRARRDIQRGIDTGRFAVASADVALVATAGAVLTYVQVALASPDRFDDTSVDALAELLLRMLGVPARSARAVVQRPLPAPSGTPGWT
ncbi:TetR family transcriptional regulator [Humibacillus xanthopallidus]|uniref:TetR family transcriptional regulator n=1 Tax=Humibacillus xanthopallidus TaxID=412689 RepID=A0A543PPX9_9MICO|nr:TetR family transcriptional regulator [Humibacillus xanthopallidus]TQN46134.1 TetR family transcriptional regulator [Humibacillus xanthopallidus]